VASDALIKLWRISSALRARNASLMATPARGDQESVNRLLKEIIQEQIWIEKLKREKRKVKSGS
jgi:transcriptional regulator of heat shock response